MDVDRFETLLRSLAASPSRRQALGLLGGTLLGAMLTQGISPTDARKRKRKGKKKRGNGRRKSACPVSCGGKVCGDDGCGGSCGSCSGGKACESGSCQCPVGTEDCLGTCIPTSAECCVAADCDLGEICVQHVCVTGKGLCPNAANSCPS